MSVVTRLDCDTASAEKIKESLSCQSTIYVPSIDSAHPNDNPDSVNFVDIFGEDTNIQQSLSNDVDCGGCSDLDNAEPTAKGNGTPLQHRKLTFSDRVLQEARKLRKRLQRTISEDAGHVTRVLDNNASPAIRRAITAEHISSYASRNVIGAIGAGYKDLGKMEEFPIVSSSTACNNLRMRSNAQIMEWFRNRYNTIEAAYSGRAVALGTLQNLKVTPLSVESSGLLPEREESSTQTPVPDPDVEKGCLQQQKERIITLEQMQIQLQQELEKARESVEELENSLAVERKHNEEGIKDKILLQQRIANYADEVKTLNESVDILKNMNNSEVEEHEKRKAEFLAKIAQLQKDITHINDNLFSCYKVIETQKTEQAYLKRENDEIKEELKKLKRELRRMYETNSNLKSQNMSLIEINNRIRTKTLFKDDGASTCSTRGSHSSKASYMSSDDFAFFHVFNDKPSSIPEYGEAAQLEKEIELNAVDGDNTFSGMDSMTSISNMTKRTTTGDLSTNVIYTHGSIFGGAAKSICDKDDGHLESSPAVSSDVPESVNQGGNYQTTLVYDNSGIYIDGDVTATGTFPVDRSTIYSADNSTLNCAESLNGRCLTTDDLSEGSCTVKNKNWLIEKVTRVSNRDSLDYLREKIKLITFKDNDFNVV
ncbi:kinectin isoform X1, putative [Babesia ovis]|uniref:Kinectin isoform X1, putative n=1 Tax=Babesia ovis TaxID=5869 RepID=A0A9W5WU36_BABOV|nr:kinectin isoform X1, putative [Babesia ovis]